MDGKPLVRFPRIWIMALSKSDLLPNLNVSEFRDLLLEKVGGAINELRETIYPGWWKAAMRSLVARISFDCRQRNSALRKLR